MVTIRTQPVALYTQPNLNNLCNSQQKKSNTTTEYTLEKWRYGSMEPIKLLSEDDFCNLSNWVYVLSF